MIRAIAIDDEPVALDIIRRHATMIPSMDMRGLFANATDALSFMASEALDLVFVDINMPGMSGLEFARQVPAEVQLVFTTGHSDYAIDGFELAITDFLLKPISLQRFSRACKLVEDRLEISSYSKEQEAVLYVRNGHDLVKVRIKDLMYIKADNNYLVFVEKDRYTLSRMTVGEALKKLPPGQFCRVHKSYVVNLRYVEKVQSERIIIGKAYIPVSRSKLQELRQKLT
jgi:two-component system LytT family response regulator